MLLLLSQMERTQSVYQAWCDKYSMLRSKFRQQPIRRQYNIAVIFSENIHAENAIFISIKMIIALD